MVCFSLRLMVNNQEHMMVVQAHNDNVITELFRQTDCWWRPLFTIFFTLSCKSTHTCLPCNGQKTHYILQKNNCFCLEGVWIRAPLHLVSARERGAFDGQPVTSLNGHFLLLLLLFFFFISFSLDTLMSSVNGEFAYIFRWWGCDWP